MSTGVLYAADPASGEGAEFPRGLTTYGDGGVDSIWTILKNRVTQEPLNLVATLIFFLANGVYYFVFRKEMAGLLGGALVPTIIMLLMFMLFR
jgi:hypothetical protein